MGDGPKVSRSAEMDLNGTYTLDSLIDSLTNLSVLLGSDAVVTPKVVLTPVGYGKAEHDEMKVFLDVQARA